MSNIGFLSFNRSIDCHGNDGCDSAESHTTQLNASQTLFELSTTLNPNARSLDRANAAFALTNNDNALVAQTWLEHGLEPRGFLKRGRAVARVDNVNQTASYFDPIDWYTMAEGITPEDSELWLGVGLVCRNRPERDEICDRFLTFNQGNLFVDAALEFWFDGWGRLQREQTTYATVPCANDKFCAYTSFTDVANFGASVFQCMMIEAGAQYRFSAEISAELEPNSQLRPIYMQGAIDGENRGFWDGDLTLTSTDGFTSFSRTFIAPAFDNNYACFHPARASGSGEVWFHSAELVEVSAE